MLRVLIKAKSTYYTVNGQKIEGSHSDIWGDVSDISGDVSGISGNVDDCIITSEDRERGIGINELIANEED